METTIIEVLRQYKENVSLSEGYYDYLIWGDEENLRDIAREIIRVLNENSAEKEIKNRKTKDYENYIYNRK